MDLKKLTDEVKDLVDERGGTDSLKEDAEELKDILSGDGSLADKAKEAAEALKDPGAEGPDSRARIRPRSPIGTSASATTSRASLAAGRRRSHNHRRAPVAPLDVVFAAAVCCDQRPREDSNLRPPT